MQFIRAVLRKINPHYYFLFWSESILLAMFTFQFCFAWFNAEYLAIHAPMELFNFRMLEISASILLVIRNGIIIFRKGRHFKGSTTIHYITWFVVIAMCYYTGVFLRLII